MLAIDNFYLKYRITGKVAVDGVSFTLAKGEIVALLGPSGCGKSTLLNAITGLITSQDAEIGGTLSVDKGGEARVNLVFQTPTLLPWRTVEENIAFGLEIMHGRSAETRKQAAEAVRMVGLEGFETYLPQQLSIGMQQRVNFARALACHPQLLLLDEPFSALDKETKKKLQAEFLRIIREKNITTLFVTHSVEEAVFLSDRIIVLSQSPARVKDVFRNGGASQEAKKAISLLEFYDE